MKEALLCLLLVLGVSADVYLHNPRGSNNRLNEKSAQRTNANRLFDSQNNNRGGYNVGDKLAAASKNNQQNQYNMKYFQSSTGWQTKTDEAGRTLLTFEWTNQHSCGGNEDTDEQKNNCNIVFQYMCQDSNSAGLRKYTVVWNDQDAFRNGVNTQTPKYTNAKKNENEAQINLRRKQNADPSRGQHESWDWYDKCFIRERNKGLFTADQKLKDNQGLGYSSSIYTRQNPNGNRRGYECPEERDYYPYWHPTPWVDIGVLADNQTMCQYYTTRSFNVVPYHECVEHWDAPKTRRKHFSRWINEQECEENGGTWKQLHNYLEKAPKYSSRAACEGATDNGVTYKWAVPHDSVDGRTSECLVALQAPECRGAPWTRTNHLGNGRDGVPNNFTWTIPSFSGTEKTCVIRVRYNISTDDYDPYHTDAKYNQDAEKMIQSPVKQNPYIQVAPGKIPLRLAINTAQFGRTFQDRTHIFKIKPRPDSLGDARLLNLNVRGKRGNIVQVYPAVEYDFFPTHLRMTEGDLVHIQWTGSNTHNNGNPGGDGQTGDAGEGTGGTDRNNIVEIASLSDNFPLPYENTSLWRNAEVVWIYHGKTIKKEDLAINMASAGYYACVKSVGCPLGAGQSGQTNPVLNNQLNNAPASYEGAVLRIAKGKYYYICSRNNNFTNRSQKGSITVEANGQRSKRKPVM